MASNKRVKLTSLLVNKENYRFEVLSSQRDAIEKIIEDQGMNLYNLAEHILKYGLNPNDKIQLYESEEEVGKYIVLEGNRRTVTLKILQNPDLIEGTRFEELKRKITKLREANKANLISEIDAVVYDDAVEADVWIGIKHGYGLSGVTTETWGTIAKQRFGEKIGEGSTMLLQVVNRLKSSNHVDDTVKSAVDKIYPTNLERLIGDPYVRETLGIDLVNKKLESQLEEAEIMKGLTKLINGLMKPDFTVDLIKFKNQRKEYIDKLFSDEKPDRTKLAATKWLFEAPPEVPKPKPTPPPKPKPNPRDRFVLIPKDCLMKISNPKVNSIYHELQKLDLRYFPIAGGVLLRVFVELSMDVYLEKKKLIASLTAAKSGNNLEQKINLVVNHLSSLNLADAAICKGIKDSAKGKADFAGLETWHAYIHNNRITPTATNLVVTWDGIQQFMEITWANID